MSLQPPTYDARRRRYRTAAGAPIDPAEVRAAVQAAAQGAAGQLAELGAQLDAGAINLSQFMLDVKATVKAAHVAALAAAAGGLRQVTPRDLGQLGAKLRSLYQGLSDLEIQYSAGTISAALLAARMGGYVRAAMGTYENAVRDQAQADGATEERRVLGVVATEHCQECLDQAALGWQSIGALIPIGMCTCGGQCCCSWETRIGPILVE